MKRAAVLILVAAALAACATTTVPPPVSSGGDEKTAVFDLPQIQLKGFEKAMSGPDVQMDLPGERGTKLWVTQWQAHLIDDDTGKETTGNYLCHVNFALVGNRSFRENKYLGLHTGTRKDTLPPGFAYEVDLSSTDPPYLYGMVADYDQIGKPKRLHYRITIKYYEDDAAKKLSIKDLDALYIDLKPTEEVEVAKDKYESSSAADARYHFLIPPGRHVYHGEASEQNKDFFKVDRQVYHIFLHLHAYGEYGEIYDKTARKTLWRGYTSLDPETSLVLRVDAYSSAAGLRFFHDHDYEFIASYNNTTSKPIDAMMTTRFYYKTIDPATGKPAQ